ncbi:MAG: hypothetical protein R3B96_12730 [Pirellulaceae bacterium]
MYSLKSTELKPFEDNYLDTLAEVEFRLGNVERAVELAAKAVSFNPRYAHYRRQLERFRSPLGNDLGCRVTNGRRRDLILPPTRRDLIYHRGHGEHGRGKNRKGFRSSGRAAG